MAARWGAGEDTLTACNMDFHQLDTLDGVMYMCHYIVRLVLSLLLVFLVFVEPEGSVLCSCAETAHGKSDTWMHLEYQ